MKTKLFFAFLFSFAILMLASPDKVIYADDTPALCYFESDLLLGTTNDSVKCLQQFLNSEGFTVAESGPGSLRNETRFFGYGTKNALQKWQEANGIFSSSDSFGLKSRLGYKLAILKRQLKSLQSELETQIASEKNKSSAIATTTTISISNVSPSTVKSGDLVTITGEGFVQTGNKVILGDGLIESSFSGLSSSDGKTIVFVYKPPNVKEMSEAEIRNLPQNIVSQIENPIKDVGKTLADALAPYKGMNNESDLSAFLQKNGHSLNELYNNYYVAVENNNGKAISNKAVLKGMRKLPFDSIAEALSSPLTSLESGFKKILGNIFPTAEAQMGGGGFNSGMIMYCTCGTGYLTFMVDYSGGGSGLYWFPPGFKPSAGTGMVSSMWIGKYIPGAGMCYIGIEPYCIYITANMPMLPWGASM